MFANITHAATVWEDSRKIQDSLMDLPQNHNDSFFKQISDFIARINSIIDWFSHLPEHIYHFTADIFAWIFKTLMMIGWYCQYFCVNDFSTSQGR